MRPVQKLLRSTRENRSLLRQEPLAHKKNQDHEFDFRRSTISRRPRSISELAGARPAKFVQWGAARSQSPHPKDSRLSTIAWVPQIDEQIRSYFVLRYEHALLRLKVGACDIY